MEEVHGENERRRRRSDRYHVCAAASTSGIGTAGNRELRFHIDRLPLADGRFHLRFALTDAGSGRLLHSLDDAVRFFVFATGTQTGAVLLEGRWTMQEITSSTPIRHA